MRARTPAALVRGASRELDVRTRAVLTERALSRAGRDGTPVLLGPFLGEIGYELEYWIPFLRRELHRPGIPPAQAAVMTRGVITCHPDDTVRDVMGTMTRARVRHLPVVDGTHLRGIISIGDVVKASVDDADLEANVLRDAYLTQRANLAANR